MESVSSGVESEASCHCHCQKMTTWTEQVYAGYHSLPRSQGVGPDHHNAAVDVGAAGAVVRGSAAHSRFAAAAV